MKSIPLKGYIKPKENNSPKHRAGGKSGISRKQDHYNEHAYILKSYLKYIKNKREIKQQT